MVRTTLAVVCLLLPFAAATASVEDADAIDLPVAYGDLDLTDARDVATLDRRIARAADRICERSSTDIRDQQRMRLVQKCLTAVIDGAAPARLAAISRRKGAALAQAEPIPAN